MSEHRRCCNRDTCPYYQGTDNSRQQQCGTTPYASANEGTSTQFLYFGSNFGSHPSGAEVREFQDCNSDTEVAVPQQIGRSLYKAASSLERTDSGNYIMTLRQIIALSNRLLEHIERKADNLDNRSAGPCPSVTQTGYGTSNAIGTTGTPCNMGQYPATSPAGTNAFNRQQSCMGMANGRNGGPSQGTIPFDIRMLRIEPVTLTIPFTIHFQSTTTLPGTGEQQQQQMGSPCTIEPIRTAMISSSQQCAQDIGSMPRSENKLFPYSSNQQADLFISKGKFPPLTGPTSSFILSNGKDHPEEITALTRKHSPPFAAANWAFPKSSPPLSTNTSAIMEIDKAVQTEKPSKVKQEKSFPSPPGTMELETGGTEKYSQTGSHRNNPHLNSTADCEFPPPPNELLDNKLYQNNLTDENSIRVKTERSTPDSRHGGGEEEEEDERSKRSKAGKQPTEEETENPETTKQSTTVEPEVISEALQENITMPPTISEIEEQQTLNDEERKRQEQLEQLEREQAMYEKIPIPVDKSTSPYKIPDNISYPSQYGRSTASAHVQSILCTADGTSVSCYSAFDTLPKEDGVPEIGIPLYCRCKCRKRSKKRKSSSRTSRSQSYSRSDFTDMKSARKTSSVHINGDDYYSADSETENDVPALRLTSKRAQGNIRQTHTKSRSNVQLNVTEHESAMLQVLQQMMQVLVHMEAMQRGVHLETTTEKSSVQTIYQSSRNEAINEDVFTNESKSTIARGDGGINYESGEEEPEQLQQYQTQDEQQQQNQEQVQLEKMLLEQALQEQEALKQEIPCVDETCAQGNRMNAEQRGSLNSMPILVITFDRETGMPCCCVHSGSMNASTQQIPIFEMQPCRENICRESQQNAGTDDTNLRNEQLGGIEECIVCDDETAQFQLLIHDEVRILSDTQIKIEPTDFDNNTTEGVTDINAGIAVSFGIPCDEECQAVCAGTQTEECIAPFLAKLNADMVYQSNEIMDELREYREELIECEEENESCLSYAKKPKSSIRSSKTRSGGDVGVECDCCHCRAERELREKSLINAKPGEVLCTDDDCKHQLKNIVDSILTDLECMEKVRRSMGGGQVYLEEEKKIPPPHARQSFPATILEVSELGLASLYVKWVIHDCFGIGGYEIYVDGFLTNRYYNSRHEAAVVCDVDVSKPHKVCLMAKPKPEKELIGAGDLMADVQLPVTPANWVPSVFLYEPSADMDYCKKFR